MVSASHHLIPLLCLVFMMLSVIQEGYDPSFGDFQVVFMNSEEMPILRMLMFCRTLVASIHGVQFHLLL
jgi:hypothetical protein